MIRGVSREIIEVADIGNTYFERAVLYVRPGLTEQESGTLAAEGARYVQSLTKNTKPNLRKSFRLRQAIWMAVSAAVGALLTYGAMLVL